MKFASELNHEAVPEWKAKYLDYKIGKKKLKAIGSAIRNLNHSPRSFSLRGAILVPPRSGHSVLRRASGEELVHTNDDPKTSPAHPQGDNLQKDVSNSRLSNRASPTPESEPLFAKNADRSATNRPVHYGSIIGTSPDRPSVLEPPPLQLPDPAVGPVAQHYQMSKAYASPDQVLGRVNGENSASKIDQTRSPLRNNFTAAAGCSRPSAKRHWTLNMSALKSWSVAGPLRKPRVMALDYPSRACADFEMARSGFADFLDAEMEKIETFYKEKEVEATTKMEVLREQMYLLQECKMRDSARARKFMQLADRLPPIADGSAKPVRASWLSRATAMPQSEGSMRHRRAGSDSGALEAQEPPKIPQRMDSRRDYQRRVKDIEVHYGTAKRKLKIALKEYYRSMELLKSYSLLNREAFRKILKKYDKTVKPQITGQYMASKIGNAWFVKSDLVDRHIAAVENLYAMYFESGNHKVATNKLRRGSKRKEYRGGAMFRNGFSIAIGTLFSVEALMAAVDIIQNGSSHIALQTSYLLQIYAGYFLVLLLMLFFCLACRIWARTRVNYVFIFELETRDNLDWRQLFELPCHLWALLGFFLWINFCCYGERDIAIYIPVILISVTILILCCPLPFIYWKARRWFLHSCWRLSWSGLYPVEFRDFFLGDMFCSLTYSMANIELFFCLYAHRWADPESCNSSHSRLLGFFSALPATWRALQCLRRYADTRNVFPHLGNFGKYACTILFYVSLSMHRITNTTPLFAFFIACGSINSIYCSVWDIFMDWSLMNPHAAKPFLRDVLAYEHNSFYYAAIVIDPILRCNWILYAIFAQQVQHSALLSFVISLAEVCRRGLWILLRVENEHCTNVGHFRASRDVPLPFNTADYRSPVSLEAGIASEIPPKSSTQPRTTSSPALTTHSDVNPAATPASGLQSFPVTPSLRRGRANSSPLVRGLLRVGGILQSAHGQDFERRKKVKGGEGYASSGDSTDEDVDRLCPRTDAGEDHEPSDRPGIEGGIPDPTK